MQLTISPDLELLVQKRLASGTFTSVEDVIRRALEAQDAEESWTGEERRALDEKIDRAIEQVTAGRIFGPEDSRRKLAELRQAHLANLG